MTYRWNKSLRKSRPKDVSAARPAGKVVLAAGDYRFLCSQHVKPPALLSGGGDQAVGLDGAEERLPWRTQVMTRCDAGAIVAGRRAW